MAIGRYIKQFLNYLNKENVNLMEGLVDPLEFHSVFATLAELFWVMDYETTPYWMKISLISTLISATTGSMSMLCSVVHNLSVGDIHLTTESGTYLVILCYQFILSVSIIRNKKHYHNFLRVIREDFNYICTRGQRHRAKFFESQLLTFKACVIAAIFTGAMGGGMAICACFGVFWSMISPGEDSVRPLPYPFWFFDINLHVSPTYELVMVAALLFTFFETYFYIFIVQSHIVWIRTIASKADIIVWNLQDMSLDVLSGTGEISRASQNEILTHRLREIVSMHQSAITMTEDYAAVFKNCLLYEQMIFSPGVCMTAFCFVEKLENGEFEFIVLLMCIAIIGVVIIPSYLCTHLLEKLQYVGEACWDVPFWNAGPVIRPYLVLIIQRSMRQLPTVAAGFEDISLKTYGAMMARAYSWFNMLRQADFNFSQ